MSGLTLLTALRNCREPFLVLLDTDLPTAAGELGSQIGMLAWQYAGLLRQLRSSRFRNTITPCHHIGSIHMGTMTIRSTYSLDADTARTIKRLARQWDASQAEVIRRSVRLAAEQAAEPAMSPAEVVAHYRNASSPRGWDEIRKLAAEMRSQRRSDERKRGARLKPARS